MSSEDRLVRPAGGRSGYRDAPVIFRLVDPFQSVQPCLPSLGFPGSLTRVITANEILFLGDVFLLLRILPLILIKLLSALKKDLLFFKTMAWFKIKKAQHENLLVGHIICL